MKSILARYPKRRALGLFVGDREVVLSRVAFTAAGPVEVDRRSEPREPGPLAPTIRRLFEPIRASRAWRRAPVGVGLPTLSVFFSTRPAPPQRAGEERSPQVLLHELLQSAHLNIDHMEVDAIRWQPGRRPLASVVACRKKAMAPLLEALEDCGVRPYQVEPAPCGLLRGAVARHRTPRRAATALRVFLGRDHALAVLTAGDAPLMWRYFPLEPGAEATAILSTYRYIAESCRVYGADAPPSAVMVHGRPGLADLGDAAGRARMPARFLRLDGPGYEAGEIAAGLALGCLPHLPAFNLARDLRPPEPILGQLPWGQLATQAAVLAGATLLLVDERRALEAAGAALAAQQASYPWLGDRPAAALRSERDDLLGRVEAVEHYLSTRILWTDCLREVAARLPDGVVVTGLDGHGQYLAPGGRAKLEPKRSLTLALDAPIRRGVAVPTEVEGLLDALRASPVLRRNLPSIDMAALKGATSGTSRAPSASFTVLCRPKGGAPGPSSR